MREIKFRGRTISGEWVYGLLARKGSQYYISNKVGAPFAYEVFLETIGQFTGLHDKNGVEIYDGDILHADTYWDIIIEFENGSFVCKALDKIQYINNIINVPIGKFDCLRFYEVIGNIYENPELLIDNE